MAKAELGLGIAVPEQWGGTGLDNLCYAIGMEEISRGCASTGVTMSVNNSLYCDPVMKYGTDGAEEGVARAVRPRREAGLLRPHRARRPAPTPPQQQTIGVKQGDTWVINGAKNWITNGPFADAMRALREHGPSKGAKGITAFIVPTDTPGFTKAKADQKLGICASPSCTIFFEDMKLGPKHVLGKEGEGFKVAMGTLDGGRIGIAAQALGIARAAYEEALAYAKERKSFGKVISEHQAIQFMLADMATEIDAARLLIWQAATMKDKGVRHSMESAMAKLYASEMCGRVTTKAVQIHGGYGYSKEFDAERHFRDAKITEIYEGTSEIQRIVIAEPVLKD